MPYLDQFYAEVGSAETGFDKIAFVRLYKGDGPVAMYFGEVLMQPAQVRNAQGQRRLYPHFDGKITKMGLSK